MKVFMLIYIVLVLLLTPCVLSSCATHALTGRRYPPSSILPPPQDSALVERIQQETQQRPRESGFDLLIDGEAALRTRLSLIEVARSSIDVQSYIWHNDEAGQSLLARLLQAANRGVRVRILVDDLHKGEDRQLLRALARHPKVEIRLFNPTSADSEGLNKVMRGMELVFDYDRLTHRMHNKVFLVDSTFVVVGGRNIGNEYFDRNGEKNFRDLDVLGAGRVATRFGKVFDGYWNASVSVPVERLEDKAGSKDLPLAERPPEMEASGQWVEERLNNMVWAPFRVLAASPDIVHDDEAETLADQLQKIPEPEHELVMETAYFIPTDGFISKLQEWHQKGVAMRILTNSMRSNDVLAAHAGYAKHREAVLQTGAALYEWRSDSQPAKTKAGKGKGIYASRANLHTKAYVIDRDYVFIGSYNLDPRSSDINTECGVLIKSPQIADAIARWIESGMQPTNSWQLTLDPDLEWKGKRKNEVVSFDQEPDSSFWQRIKVKVIGWLPIDAAL